MKKIFVLSFISAGYFLNAQTVGNTPYAAFGLGDTKYDNSVDIASMGGISTAYISDFTNDFNFRNPAANQNLELTTLKVEGTNENNFFKTDYNGGAKSTKHSTYLSNISIAFPLSKKVKFGLGFQPYSSKNYNVSISRTLDDGSVEKNNFVGSGTVNLVQGALSYSPTQEFSLGMRTNFLFGNVTDSQEFATSGAELYNGYKTKNRVKSFNFTLGSTYQKKFENDRKFTLGAYATFGNTGDIRSSYTNSTYYYSDSQTQADASVIDESQKNIKNILPMEYSIGAGYGHEAKWFVSSQLEYRKGEDFNFFGTTYENNSSYKISVGGWYLPNINNFRNYFSRVIYRYGAYYEKGNLNINGNDINKYALTFGMTLPFSNTGASRLSSFNLGLELGKKGTLQNDLINQNFVNLRFGINFADKWFNKRLYD